MPIMKAYEREHLKLLEGILTQLTRIANAMEGDVLEPEEVYSEETLTSLSEVCAVGPDAYKNLADPKPNEFDFRQLIK